MDGFWTLHKKYGKLHWKELWKPSIALSRYGFVVSEFMAGAIAKYADYFQSHKKDWAFLFDDETGALFVEGGIMRRPQYAKTLKTISSKNGLEKFYHGRIAKSLVAVAKKGGGIITLDDFKQYRTLENDTIRTNALDREFITCPSPCRHV